MNLSELVKLLKATSNYYPEIINVDNIILPKDSGDQIKMKASYSSPTCEHKKLNITTSFANHGGKRILIINNVVRDFESE